MSTMQSVELARGTPEQRGLESFDLPSHSHIPLSRRKTTQAARPKANTWLEIRSISVQLHFLLTGGF